MMSDPVVDKIVAHLARVATGDIPATACKAAKAFIADTLAVGIAGARAPWRREILDMAGASGGIAEASVWGGGERMPLANTALVNAYQVHCQEFDCVHEGAVVHPMAAVLPSLLGWAERTVALLVRTATIHGGSVGYVIGVVFILLGVLRWRALH